MGGRFSWESVGAAAFAEDGLGDVGGDAGIEPGLEGTGGTAKRSGTRTDDTGGGAGAPEAMAAGGLAAGGDKVVGVGGDEVVVEVEHGSLHGAWRPVLWTMIDHGVRKVNIDFDFS